MSENNNQKSIMSNSREKEKTSKNWWIEIVSLIIISYLIFSLISPMFINEVQNLPRKIEASDIILIAVILLFNSGLLNRIENFGVSKDGVTAKFQEIIQKVEDQRENINEFKTEQLEQLEKQQKELEEMQVFMYDLLLEDHYYQKIADLDKHSQTNTSYEFNVSEGVAQELRHLRNLKLIDTKLIDTKKAYISDIVRASNNGTNSIDLTHYLYVTDLGKKFLETRAKLHNN